VKIKISRSGFRKAPSAIEEQAQRHLRAVLDGIGLENVVSARAELRRSAYIGPEGASTRGGHTMNLHVVTKHDGVAFDLSTFEMPEGVGV
jgi:hypothetical protein